jgi:hypothetical protein
MSRIKPANWILAGPPPPGGPESSNAYIPISLPPAGDQDYGLVSHQQPIAFAPYL